MDLLSPTNLDTGLKSRVTLLTSLGPSVSELMSFRLPGGCCGEFILSCFLALGLSLMSKSEVTSGMGAAYYSPKKMGM